MIVQMNQKPVHLPENATVRMLLEKEGYGKNVAVWVNGKRLLQREYPVYSLQQSDDIRVLRPLGGG